MSIKREVSHPGSVDERALEIGARIEHGPSPRLIESAFQAELDAQLPLFDALSRVDLAHTLVMGESGIIPPEAARDLINALNRLRQSPDDFCPDAATGDLYTNREAWLIGQTPAAAWLGAGRARREAITTAYVIYVREEMLTVTQAVIELTQALVDRSEAYVDALMPDYTYLQQAQPTSVGHYLLGFAYPLLRDLQRIGGLYTRINQSPAGCGSSNGSRLPQSRERLAELLGFQGLVMHARDAMWQVDVQIEIAAFLCSMLVNLDRLAEDLQIFASDEFGIVEFDDSHSRASKIMPQKKNPFALTHIRGLANCLIGTLTTTAAVGRTPSGQPDNRLVLYGAIPKAINDTRTALSLMSEVVSLLQFNTTLARARLENGFLLATDLVEVLALERAVPFRDAHRLVGRLVREYLQEGDFQQLTAKALADCAEGVLGRRIALDDAVLKSALNPEACVASRREQGGAAPEAMAEMISHCRQQIAAAKTWCDQRQSHLNAAECALEHRLSPYLNGATSG